MSRLACVDLTAFPLQLLLRQHPQWAEFPAAVVDADKPQAKVLWACERARALGVLPGLRYAHALGLAAGLCAGVVSRELVLGEVLRVAERLRELSPDVEPYAEEPGVFWLSGVGLGGLHRSASAWGRAIVGALEAAGYRGSVVVGFTRFGSYAVSKRGEALLVLRDRAAERRATSAIPLTRLGMDAELRDWVLKLGVSTLGGYIELPPQGILLRFGHAALKLHELASGVRYDPLQPDKPLAEVVEHVLLDDSEEDATRLLFWIKGALDRLLAALAERQQALGELVLELELDHAPMQRESIKPAEPTLDHRTLMRLLHLRLESAPPCAGVRELRLGAESVPARVEQLTLFFERPRRDVAAANAALAELRAELGNGAVCKAVLADGHLPEAQFSWEPLDELALPQPNARLRENKQAKPARRPLVRRIQQRPSLVPPARGSLHDDGWLLSGLEHGTVVDLQGPYVISSGWWRSEVLREYAFAQTKRGDWLWVYYDRGRRRWFIQGVVE